MRKYKSAFLKPYIRVARSSDFDGAKANDLRTAIMMGIIEDEGHKAYVLVQRGTKGIIAIGRTKRELRNLPAIVAVGKMKFNQWANLSKRQCRK